MGERKHIGGATTGRLFDAARRFARDARRRARPVATVALSAALAVALVLPLAIVTGTAHAEVAAADPIDAAMRACSARADMSSTSGQVQCMDTARAAWKGATDIAYRQLMTKGPDARRKGWEDSQKRWSAWRDAERPLLQAVFATTHGTAYVLSQADMELQPVRDRALMLRAEAARTDSVNTPPGSPGCGGDAQCEHAEFDLNRYYRRLYVRMPARSRAVLVRAERAWLAYRDATTPLVNARSRLDLIGARVATLKRLSETVGND